METAQGKPLNIDPFSNVPPELKTYANWVCYTLRDVPGEDKPKKVPINPDTGKEAKANDPTTWASYEKTVEHWGTHKHNGIAGIGFEVGKSLFTGIDLDNCVNLETGQLEPWAKEIVETLNTYTEISPSGTGLRMFITLGAS